MGAGPSPTVRPQKTGRADRVQTNRRAIQSESGLLVWALGSGIVGRRDRNQRSELREMLGRQGGTGGGAGGRKRRGGAGTLCDAPWAKALMSSHNEWIKTS